jgi:hypothetical protein
MDGKYAAFIAGHVNRDFGIGERDAPGQSDQTGSFAESRARCLAAT